MTFFKKNFWTLFVIYTRYALGGAIVFASIIKIKGNRFTTNSGEDYPINSAWHMFETLYQSGLFWEFIGWSQLVVGALLMTQKWAKLGALLCFPITLNIFIITLSYYFAYTPVITGMMLLANLLLLAWDWQELKSLINIKPIFKPRERLEYESVWALTGLLLFLFTVIYRISVKRYDLFLWLIVCFLIGISGLIYGYIKHRKISIEYN